MIYAADFRVDGPSYERLRDYIETAALPIQQNQDEEKRRRLQQEDDVRKVFWG